MQISISFANTRGRTGSRNQGQQGASSKRMTQTCVSGKLKKSNKDNEGSGTRVTEHKESRRER